MLFPHSFYLSPYIKYGLKDISFYGFKVFLIYRSAKIVKITETERKTQRNNCK